MGVDRKNLDKTQKLVTDTRPRTVAGLAPARGPSLPPSPGLRPPPPPQRGKRPEATEPKPLVTSSPPVRNLSPYPADMAFARTLPLATQRIEAPERNAPPEEPTIAAQPATVRQPIIAQQAAVASQLAAAQQLAAADLPIQAERAPALPADSSPATTTNALEAPQPATTARRRFPTSRLLGIGLGCIIGFGAAALFSYRGWRTPATAALPSATIQTAPAATAAPKALPVVLPAHSAAIAPATAGPAAGNPGAQEPTPATPALLLNSTVPSCHELLGSAHVAKPDTVAAFEQTQTGQRELVRGNVVEAQAAFCKAALGDATNAERWLNLTQLFLIRRDGAKAAECAQTALALQPSHPRGKTMLGDAWAMLGKHEEARAAYLAAEGRAEPDAKALQLMIRRDMEEAQRMVKRRDFVRAERLFRRVMVFDSQHVEAGVGLTASLAKLSGRRE